MESSLLYNLYSTQNKNNLGHTEPAIMPKDIKPPPFCFASV